MISVILLGLFISIFMLVIRAVMGKTVFDRILAVNSIGTNVILLIVLLSIVFDTEFFIDVAIIYALINFISTIAFLRYFRLVLERKKILKKKSIK